MAHLFGGGINAVFGGAGIFVIRIPTEAFHIGRVHRDHTRGTHALIQDTVQFARLGLVIVDEQHRFGVGQRLTLRNKGSDGLVPHQLMMSATPIPRTLAMTYYADLEVSVIDELPPGRTPIVTRAIDQNRRSSPAA